MFKYISLTIFTYLTISKVVEIDLNHEKRDNSMMQSISSLSSMVSKYTQNTPNLYSWNNFLSLPEEDITNVYVLNRSLMLNISEKSKLEPQPNLSRLSSIPVHLTFGSPAKNAGLLPAGTTRPTIALILRPIRRMTLLLRSNTEVVASRASFPMTWSLWPVCKPQTSTSVSRPP